MYKSIYITFILIFLKSNLSFAGFIKRNANDFTGKVYLISIGINDYDSTYINLNYCESDAKNFAKRLKSDSTILELIEYNFYSHSKRTDILNALSTVVQKANTGDAFIFYCASIGYNSKIYLSDLTSISSEEIFAKSQEMMCTCQLYYLDISGEDFIVNLRNKFTKNPEESAISKLNRVIISVKGVAIESDKHKGGPLTLSYTRNPKIKILDAFSPSNRKTTQFLDEMYKFTDSLDRLLQFELAIFSEYEFYNSFIDKKDITRNANLGQKEETENQSEKFKIKKGETLCLIVGCSKFDNFDILPNSLNDALAIEETLKNNYKTKILQLYNPTCNEFRKTLSSIANTYEFEEGSQFLLFSATHGAKDENEVGCMLFKDSKTDEDGLLQNTFALPNIKKAIAQLKATNTLLILDICHSGTMFEIGQCKTPNAIEIPKESSIFANNSQSSPAYKNFLNQKTNFFIGSSSDQESADGRGEHSPFSTVVLDFFNKNDLPVIDSYHLQKEIVNNVMNAGAISIPKFCTYDCEDNGRFLFIKK